MILATLFHPSPWLLVPLVVPALQVAIWLLAILVQHALGIVLWVRFTAWEVGVNAAMIEADGSADTLKAGFHSRRTWIRFWVWLGLTLPPALGLALGGRWLAAGLSFAALGLLLACYFVRTFNPQLNVRLGLAYKARFYVSPSPTAAFYPDRYIWRHVRQHDGGQHTDAELQDFANEAAHLWLNILLWVGIVAEGAFLIFCILF